MPSNNKKNRKKEFCESEKSIDVKVEELNKMLLYSRCTLIYTGAGISTSAQIPDYRGPTGLWTLASQGKDPLQIDANLLSAEPTLSHMIIKELYRKHIVDHVLSQNCDGLHLRSGLPQKALSEIHGNMYIEVCSHCSKQHVRNFDVTAKSSFRKHGTGRVCSMCRYELQDTIVHFGELGKVPFPLNWEGITPLVPKADLIICLGTSLQVLKSYKMLWPEQGSKTKLVIVNLQWTPKDNMADIKIHGKCDVVLEKLAELLELDMSRKYCRDCDIVTNPRRQSMMRDRQLMNDVRDCTCHIRPPRIFVDSPSPLTDSRDQTPPQNQQPGWWQASFNRMSGGRLKALKMTSSGRKRGRPRKCGSTDEEPSCSTSSAESIDPTYSEPKRKRGRPSRIDQLLEEAEEANEQELIELMLERMVGIVVREERREKDKARDSSEELPTRRVTRSQVQSKEKTKEETSSKKKKSKYVEPEEDESFGEDESEGDEADSEEYDIEEEINDELNMEDEEVELQQADAADGMKKETEAEKFDYVVLFEPKQDQEEKKSVPLLPSTFQGISEAPSDFSSEIAPSTSSSYVEEIVERKPIMLDELSPFSTMPTTSSSTIIPLPELSDNSFGSRLDLLDVAEDIKPDLDKLDREIIDAKKIDSEISLIEYIRLKTRQEERRKEAKALAKWKYKPTQRATFMPKNQPNLALSKCSIVAEFWTYEMSCKLREIVLDSSSMSEGLSRFLALREVKENPKITFGDVLQKINSFPELRDRFVQEGISKNVTNRSFISNR